MTAALAEFRGIGLLVSHDRRLLDGLSTATLRLDGGPRSSPSAPVRRSSTTLELVAALGCDPQRLLASEAPSPGEARKLKLAFGLGRRVWALLLDEPTNHLDLPSIERLEDPAGATGLRARFPVGPANQADAGA